jgi:hypothetical protein
VAQNGFRPVDGADETYGMVGTMKPKVLDEALEILGDLPALWTSLDDNGKQAWVQVLFQKLVINDRGKVVDRLLNHPFDEILEFKKGRSNSVRLSSP